MATLNECRSELRSIISAIRSIEDGISSSFNGIGEDLCARSLERVACHYDYVLRRLQNVRTNVFADWVNNES